MYTKKELLNYLYWDIETKPKWSSFKAMPKAMQKIWLEKHHFKALQKEIELKHKQLALENFYGEGVLTTEGIEDLPIPTVDEIYIKEAGLYAEFAELFCISFGVFDKDYNKVVNTIQNDDEQQMILDFLKILEHFKQLNLFGYNIDEFDIPFLLKRMWYNGIVSNYPPQLQLRDAKPWTVNHIDHMKNVKSLGWAPITLDLLCEVLGIQTSKDKFSNSEFTTLLSSGKITKEEGIEYCEKDIVATMDVALAFASNDSNYSPEPKKWGAKKTV